MAGVKQRPGGGGARNSHLPIRVPPHSDTDRAWWCDVAAMSGMKFVVLVAVAACLIVGAAASDDSGAADSITVGMRCGTKGGMTERAAGAAAAGCYSDTIALNVGVGLV